MFIFSCIFAFIISFAGSVIFKMTYVSPRMKKYSVKWSDEIGEIYTDFSYGEKPLTNLIFMFRKTIQKRITVSLSISTQADLRRETRVMMQKCFNGSVLWDMLQQELTTHCSMKKTLMLMSIPSQWRLRKVCLT